MEYIILSIVLIVILLIILPYFFMVIFFFNKLFKRKKIYNLIDLDLKETNYKNYVDKINYYYNNLSNYSFNELKIDNNGISLYAKYYDNNSDKTIICVHGFRATPENNFQIQTKYFIENNYNVLHIIQRCHGKSEGKYITFGVEENMDVVLWINKINELYKPKSIALYGLSMGAGSILLSLDKIQNSNVKIIISDCGFKSSFDAIKYGFIRAIKREPKLLCFGIKIYAKMHKINLNNNIIDILKNNQIPILFVHGINDNLVPVGDSDLLYNAQGGEKELLKTNSYHAMSIYTDEDLVINKILSHLLKYM